MFMNLRFYTLIYCATHKFGKKTSVFLLVLLSCLMHGQGDSGKDLKKQADNLFAQEDYTKAYKLYSQLVSNFPKDPEYNFKLGVCMIYSEPDKKKCLPYLKYAATFADDNKELNTVYFYLGKASHINYLFDEAIKHYNTFKLTASSSQMKKFQVNREIKSCNDGKRLLSNLTDLEVISKAELSENDYFRSYKKTGGRLLVKPDEFKTGIDKKKKEKSVVFLPNGSNVVYFSSYGNSEENGKDLYTAFKLPNGGYSKPEKVKGVNTEFDEDYPFLHPDGKTLYFSSKGYNSMGGYDIFKSVFNEQTGSWGTPVNLEFPINSPDDDFLFVTDSLETQAYFSTGRQSAPGKIDVLKVKTKRRPIDMVAMKGNVIQGSPEHELRSTISVKDVFSQNELGSFNAKEDGSYFMELPNGSKLLFTVETPGFETQSAQVSLPMASAAKPYKQTISYEQGKLKILNYFDESADDDNYLHYLNIIEKKAKLDVNASSEDNTPLAVNTPNEQPKEDPLAPLPKQQEQTKAQAPDPKKAMDNKQLSKLAKQDADDLREAAAQLNRDFRAANELGISLLAAADKKSEEAEQAFSRAESMEDEAEKKTAFEEANELNEMARTEKATAEKMLQLARSFENDARNKEKESQLNAEYAKELEKSLQNKNNKVSLARLEELQKQISELSEKESESETVVNEIKNEIEEKEKQIADIEQSTNSVKTNLEDVQTAIRDKEADLNQTRKKAAKKQLGAEIDELKAEENEKKQQILSLETETKQLNDELASVKNQLDQATKITTEDIVVKSPVAVKETQITSADLKEKYKNRISVTDMSNKSLVEESTGQLNSYNKELDDYLSKIKGDLAKTKDKNLRQKLNNEIKSAEAAKKENQAKLAANNKRLTELNQLSAPAVATGNTFDVLTAESSAEAINKLNTLNTQLNVNDTENFDYNGYQNPLAQNLKIEADARINDAIARQKKLKEDIVESKNAFENESPVLNIDQLTSEAEELNSQAQKLRNESKTKTGAEKSSLLNEAKNLENQANTKYIDAAKVIETDNARTISVNQENIEQLINTGNSTEEEISQANTLNEEATVAFKKAADIRLEGNSLSNAGGKLGSYSNAEEKEAEAILKQQQAITLLMKSNPSFELKTAAAAAQNSGEGNGENQNYNSKLETVNSGLSDLAKIKTESYQKLYEANDLEIEQLLSDISEHQEVIDYTPSIKTNLIAAGNKTESAKTNKQNSDNATNPNEKLSALVTGIKKQTEAIKQLNEVKLAINEAISTQKNLATAGNPQSGQNPEINNTNVRRENSRSNDELDDLRLLSELDMEEPQVTSGKQDMTTGQVLTYLDNNNLVMRNPQAGAEAKNSLSLLKNFEQENTKLNEALNRLNNGGAAQLSSEELNAKSETLISETETLNNEIIQIKQEASDKTGEEKEQLLKQVKALEIESQDKMIEAADYKHQANDMQHQANSKAISELIEKLKYDNPDLAEEIEEKRNEYAPLKSQINNLRTEANALSNKAAKIGAISNAEEKELELIQKQKELLVQLQNIYPDYVVTTTSAASSDDQKKDLMRKQSELLKKQYTELINLINAFSLEYEFAKGNLPSNLNSRDQKTKKAADKLNKESKQLVIKSSQEKNETEKIKILTLAARLGNEALEKLNTIVPATGFDQGNVLDDLARLDDETPYRNEIRNEPEVKTRVNIERAAVRVEGLEVFTGNAYSEANPIPIDSKMDEGLIFRVQIGAFRTRLPNNAFKGLSPLNGETTNSGYIRYTAGNFTKIENANAVKNDLRNIGYSDAFVVVYYNGKRITLAEALAEMDRQGKKIDPNAPKSAGITANSNVPVIATPAPAPENIVVAKSLEQTNGLLYTIQVGVYTKQITKPQLLSLRPIFREEMANGLFRYTAGIYNNPEKLLVDKKRVVELGIKDAFVSAYLNGKRIPFSEARDRQANDVSLKMEQENPVIFPEEPFNPSNTLEVQQVNTSGIEPFRNEVQSYPAETFDNGVKTTESGITFKVQIGAFSKQVPADVAAKFSAIKTWPVENKYVNGLFIYNIGNFSESRFAKVLRDEAMGLGIADAFITVYRDGKKLYGTEAESYLR